MASTVLPWTLYCVLLLNVIGASGRDEPALKFRITRRGLDYANRMASNLLNQEIRTLRIADIEDGDTKASNVRLTDFRPPAYSYSLAPPSTLSWGFEKAGISLSADVRGCKRVIFKICKTFKVEIDANDVQIRASAKLGRTATGQPSIVSLDCRASIGEINLKIRGGILGWIVGLFRNKIARKLKPKIEEQLCPRVERFLLNNVNAKLASFPTQTKIGGLFNLDYGLVSDPVITNEYIEVLVKGKITLPNLPAIASPYSPVPMTHAARDDRMLYAWVSDTVVNDLLYFAHISNTTRLLLTENTPSVGPFLKFNCGADSICLGSALPDLKAKFPPTVRSAEALLTTTSPPLVRVNGDNTASLSVNGTIDLYAAFSNNISETRRTIAFVEINLKTNLQIKVQNMRLTGRVRISQLQVRVLKSELDFLTAAQLEMGLPSVVAPILEQLVNERLAIGVQIPITKGIDLINSKISLLDRVVQVESDAVYNR